MEQGVSWKVNLAVPFCAIRNLRKWSNLDHITTKIILGIVFTKLKVTLDYTWRKKLFHNLKLNQYAAAVWTLLLFLRFVVSHVPLHKLFLGNFIFLRLIKKFKDSYTKLYAFFVQSALPILLIQLISSSSRTTYSCACSIYISSFLISVTRSSNRS